MGQDYSLVNDFADLTMTKKDMIIGLSNFAGEGYS